MGLKKLIANFFGFGNHELHEDGTDHEDGNVNNYNLNSVEESHHHDYSNLPRKGFSVPVQVPVDRAHQIGPIFVPCVAGNGGVQGLGWYSRRLRIDEDGDVADEFIEEITETSSNAEVHQKQFPRFEFKLNTKSARARNACLSHEGTIQHSVEFRGRLLLI